MTAAGGEEGKRRGAEAQRSQRGEACSLLEWALAASPREVALLRVDRVTDAKDRARILEV